ncbi:MAG TPA: histidine kinase [Thermoanaerobacterales bacterium]|jgi:hypothetical protein|nr:histidine kinase [Thermoanaerobacterales bacterium]
MIYKDLMKLLIIFIIFLSLGIQVAEKGLNDTMGLDIRPRSFDFIILDDRVYNFTVLGNSFKLQRYYKIGDIFADKGCITLNINGKMFKLNSVIPTRVMLKGPLNLDKKSANMYN